MEQWNPQALTFKVLEYPVQYVCHTIDPTSKKVTFVAFDSFNSHHFSLDPQLLAYGTFESFYGNNECHLQKYISTQL